MVDGRMGHCEIHGRTEVDYWDQCEICVAAAYASLNARYARGGDLNPYIGKHRRDDG